MKQGLLAGFRLIAAIASLSAIGRPAFPADSLGPAPGGWNKATGKRILYFTKSAGFEHSVVKRPAPDQLSHSEQILAELGRKHGFEVVCTKEGTAFTPENLARFDVIAFFTSSDLFNAGTDQTPAMTPAGKAALFDAIGKGKGFVAFHAATDSFHFKPSLPGRDETFVSHGDKVDPYVAMLGGEFMRHGPQQLARLLVVDRQFPGCEGLKETIDLRDEWYTFKDFAPDMHVILALQTKGMEGIDYRRAPFPYSWARMQGKGRVFYTGLAHREDVWSSPLFQDLVLGGLGWAARNIDADVTPNLQSATPGCHELQPEK